MTYLESHHGSVVAVADGTKGGVIITPAEHLDLIVQVPGVDFRREAFGHKHLGEVVVAPEDHFEFLLARQQTGAGDAVDGELVLGHALEADQLHAGVHLCSHLGLVRRLGAAPAHQRFKQLHFA